MSQGIPRQLLTVPLGVGINSELDDKLVAPGSLLSVENQYSDKSGRLIKRPGSRVASRPSTQATIPSGVTLPAIWQLASYKDALVRLGVSGTPTPIATRIDDDLWAVPGQTSSALTTKARGPIKSELIPILQGNAASADSRVPDGQIIAGRYAVTAIEHLNGAVSTVITKIFDLETQQTIASNTTGSGCIRPRVAVSFDRAVVVYIDTTTNAVIAETYNLDAIGTGAPASTATIYNAEPLYYMIDVFTPQTGPLTSSVLIAYANSAGVLHLTEFIPATNTVQNDSVVRDTATVNVTAQFVMSFIMDPSGAGLYGICVADATNGLRGLWDIPAPNGGTVTAGTTTVLDNSAEAKNSPVPGTDGIWNVTAFTTTDEAAGVYTAFYDILHVGDTSQSYVRNANKTSGGQAQGTQFRGMMLRSKAFVRDGYYYVLGVYANSRTAAIQSTYYLLRGELDAPVAPLATVARWQGGRTETANGLGSVMTITEADTSSDVFYIPVTIVTSIESATQQTRGTALAKLEFITGAETVTSPPIQFLDWLIVPGGTVMMFDGTTYTEVTFANRPERPTLTATAGGSMEDGEHGYQLCYAWTDATGRVFRSEPSVLFAGTTSGANNSITVGFGYLHNTNRTNAVVEIYRAATGTSQTYNLVTTIANDPLTLQGSFVDTLADASIASNTELYTDGGGLGNQTIPGANVVQAFDGRLWIADGETLWFSNQAGPGDGLVFNDVNTLDVIDHRGKLRAMTVLDDRLILTKDDGVYALMGQGPDGRGVGGTYTVQLIATGVGSDNPKSIASTQDGVWLNSTSQRAGIHTISRGLTVEYTGGGVRRYTDETIVSAVTVPERNQIRWYTESGRTLVWDWTSKIWTTNTGQAAVSAVVNDDIAYYAAGDAGILPGCVLAEDPTTYAEGTRADGTYITYPQRVRLPWLILSALQGFVLVDDCQGVGNVAGAHILVANLHRNYDDTVDGQIGSFTKEFAAGDKWNWELLPRVKKLTSMSVELTAYDTSMVTPPTAGVIMEAAVFTVAVLGGSRRYPGSERMKAY